MAEEKKGFFKRLVSGLTKTRDNIVAGFDSLFTDSGQIKRPGGNPEYQGSQGVQAASY